MPERAHTGDAGYDLRSVEEMELVPGGRALVRTGISVALPGGYAGLVLPRSGLAVRHGISLVNAPGLIDSGYRGEILIPLINHDRQEPFRVEEGTSIAQLVPCAPGRRHLRKSSSSKPDPTAVGWGASDPQEPSALSADGAQ